MLPGSTLPSRYYANFVGTGFVSTSVGLTLDIGGSITNIQAVSIGTRMNFLNTGTVGVPTKIYWYMEPEQ